MKFNGIATCSRCKQSYEWEYATPVKELTSSRRIEFIDSANRKPGTSYLKLVAPFLRCRQGTRHKTFLLRVAVSWVSVYSPLLSPASVEPKPPLRSAVTLSSSVIPNGKKTPCINFWPYSISTRVFEHIFAIICPSLSE